LNKSPALRRAFFFLNQWEEFPTTVGNQKQFLPPDNWLIVGGCALGATAAAAIRQ
jgi:hypothetical protein